MEEKELELNSQENAQTQEPRTYTQEEYDELAKKFSESQDQLKASTKEAQKLSWISRVAVDNTQFLKLYRSDKKQAEAVAKHFWRTADDLYTDVKNEYWDTSSWIDIEDVEAKAEAIANKKFAEQTLNNFKKEFGITWGLEKVWKSEFDGLMDWKDWESEEVLKQAKRALKLCKDTDEFQAEFEKANSRLAWAGITWSSKGVWGQKDKWPYAQYKEQEAKNSIFGAYGKSKDF